MKNKNSCDKCGRAFKTKEGLGVHKEHCRKKKRSKRSIAKIIAIIVIIVIIWGIIGGKVAQNVGITCDIGFGDKLCWTWHKNVIGQVTERLNDLFSGNG